MKDFSINKQRDAQRGTFSIVPSFRYSSDSITGVERPNRSITVVTCSSAKASSKPLFSGLFVKHMPTRWVSSAEDFDLVVAGLVVPVLAVPVVAVAGVFLASVVIFQKLSLSRMTRLRNKKNLLTASSSGEIDSKVSIGTNPQ